ncbi:MAG: hypothetical protein JST82_17280 [Bacteroidetes bacterium]|nr:hypothetical protein [Bacteroidota bacterium]
MKAANIHQTTKQKLFGNKFLTYMMQFNPFRGQLVEVEMKVVGRRIVYSYTKVRDSH